MGSGQPIKDFEGSIADDDPVVEAVVEKAFFFQLAQVEKEVAIKSAGVQNIDLFVMDLQLVPGQHFKKFIQCSEATWQDDGCVAAVIHPFFSGMHVGDDRQLGKAFVVMLPTDEQFGNNTQDVDSFRQGGVCYETHQSGAAAAIDQLQFEQADIFTQFDRMPGEDGVVAVF